MNSSFIKRRPAILKAKDLKTHLILTILTDVVHISTAEWLPLVAGNDPFVHIFHGEVVDVFNDRQSHADTVKILFVRQRSSQVFPHKFTEPWDNAIIGELRVNVHVLMDNASGKYNSHIN